MNILGHVMKFLPKNFVFLEIFREKVNMKLQNNILLRRGLIMKIKSFICLVIISNLIFLNVTPGHSEGILAEDVDAAIEEEEYQKSAWYFGFGLGTGKGEIEGNSFSARLVEISGVDAPDISQLITLNYGLGAIVTEWAHIGFDGSALRQQASYKVDGISGNSSFQIINSLCAITVYPVGRSFFLKGGYGFCVFGAEGSDDTDYSYSGRSFLLGTGFDFPLNKTFRMGIHAEYSRQSYNKKDAPDDTNFFNVYVSFYWF